jgi:hypothetical protein
MPNWVQSIVTTLIARVVETLPPDKLRGFLDDVLNAAERVIRESETEMDDKLLLPAIRKIREAFLSGGN